MLFSYKCVGDGSIPIVEATRRELTANAAKFRKATLAESAKKQYALHGHYWLRFCTVFGIPEVPEEDAAICFVTFLAQELKSSHLSVIR